MRVVGAIAVAAALTCALTGCGSRARDSPVLVEWNRIGSISLGEPRSRLERDYGRLGVGGYYALHGSRVYVDFRDGVVNDIGFTTRYYRTATGFGVGSAIPLGPCHRTAGTTCEHRWHGFVWNAIVKDKPCSCWVKVGDRKQSLPATGANFLRHWTIIEVRHGRVNRFYFSRKYVD